jgi:hypothetical protein
MLVAKRYLDTERTVTAATGQPSPCVCVRVRVCVASENSSKNMTRTARHFLLRYALNTNLRQSNSQNLRFSPAVNGHGPKFESRTGFRNWETKELESLAKEPVIQTLQRRRLPVQNECTVCQYGRRTKNMTAQVT